MTQEGVAVCMHTCTYTHIHVCKYVYIYIHKIHEMIYSIAVSAICEVVVKR